MKKTERSGPVAYGTGFVALDVVVDRSAPAEARFFAGGTCGNVMAILSFLGWRSVPISRLSRDPAGELVREDLAKWGVHLDLLDCEPRAATPIVVEEIYQKRSGLPAHRYLWTCPHCGAYLPQFRAVHAKSVDQILTSADSPSVFFFDRVSRAAIDLAQVFSEKGAVIVFEPSGSSDPRLFREALRLCHVLKYSSQRAHAFSDLLKSSAAWLEIETLGEDGLRYKTTLPLCHQSGWTNVTGFDVEEVKDAAGSGDWCTAGVLSKLAQHGQAGFAVTSQASLDSALRYGQALSAWNCRFASPRGGMYATTPADFNSAIAGILRGRVEPQQNNGRSTRRSEALARFCPTCTVDNRVSAKSAKLPRPRAVAR